MIVFAEPFIRLWMLGPEFDEGSVHQAALVMQILAASKLPLLFVGVSGSVLNAMGRVRLTTSLVVAEASLNLACSLVFVLGFGWGLAGIAGGTLAARLLVGTFIVPWYACSKAGVPWQPTCSHWRRGPASRRLVRGVVPERPAVLPAGSWSLFFTQVALATSLYVLVAYRLLMPKPDRLRLRNLIVRHSLAGAVRDSANFKA